VCYVCMDGWTERGHTASVAEPAGRRELMRPASAIVSAWMKCPTAVARQARMVAARWGWMLVDAGWSPPRPNQRADAA
jgi:hypothetical protein